MGAPKMSFYRLAAGKAGDGEGGEPPLSEGGTTPSPGADGPFALTRDELVFRAGLTRFFLGTISLIVLPLLYPSARQYLWVYAAYLGFAAIEQVLIRKRIGGAARS